MDPFSTDPFGDRAETRSVQVGGRTVVVKRRLAEGGFGSVDLVQDARTGDELVLKTMMVMVRVTATQMVLVFQLSLSVALWSCTNDRHYSNRSEQVDLFARLYE